MKIKKFLSMVLLVIILLTLYVNVSAVSDNYSDMRSATSVSLGSTKSHYFSGQGLDYQAWFRFCPTETNYYIFSCSSSAYLGITMYTGSHEFIDSDYGYDAECGTLMYAHNEYYIFVDSGERYSSHYVYVRVHKENHNIETSSYSITLPAGNEYYYKDGTPIYPNVTITGNGETLRENRDYVLSYQNNKNIGTGTIVIEGIGDYTGIVYKSFSIVRHTHSWDRGTVITAATCKNTGTKKLTCTTCRETKTETIPKTTSHSYTTKVSADNLKTEATCHSAAVYYKSCSLCGARNYNSTFTNGTADTTKHIYDNACDTSCNICGITRATTHKYNALWSSDSNNHWYTCSICLSKKDVATHTYGSWTKVNDSTHKHTCAVCAKDETTSHTWNSGVTTKTVSCKEAGSKTYACTGCSATKTETIAKLTTHTYDHACDTTCNVCGLTRTTTHSYKTEWSKDKANHWHECSVCKDKKDSATHTPSAAATETKAQTCTTCGYIITPALGHKHSYATTWSTDENGHWYKCSGCEEKGNYADHDFENACDTDCSICGYTRQTQHTYEEKWATDKDNHWHECTGCGQKQDEAAHEPGAAATDTTAQTCTICGYEIAPATGAEEAKPTTKPTTTTPTQSSKSETPVKDKEGGFPWVIVVVAIIAIGGATAGVILWKKKH